jgi:RNA polymerase sigma-70 factor (ECF subfamily)
MTDGTRLSTYFWPHLSPEVREAVASRDRLDSALADVLELARSSFPEVHLAPEVFLAFLAGKVPSGKQPEEAVLQLKVADLYLACACLHREPNAVARLENEYLGAEVDAALARMETPSVQIEDVKQLISQKLLVSEHEDRPARLAR